MLGRRPAVGVRDRGRRVLADLGRGRRPADRAERVRAGAGGGGSGADRRAGAGDAALPRAAGDHGSRARSARGATRTPGTGGCRGRTSSRRRSGSRGRASPPGTGSSARSRRRCRPIVEALGPGSGFEQVYRPNGRAWRPGERVRLPALAATLDRLAEEGFDDFYEGEIAERQAAGLAAIGCRITGADLAAHTSTWTAADRDDLSRRPGHDPPAEQLGDRRPRAAQHPRDVRAAGGRRRSGRSASTTRAGSISGSRPRSSAMADRDFHLTDPEFVEIPVAELTSKDHAAELARLIDPHRAAMPPAVDAAARRRDDLPRDGRRARATRSA